KQGGIAPVLGVRRKSVTTVARRSIAVATRAGCCAPPTSNDRFTSLHPCHPDVVKASHTPALLEVGWAACDDPAGSQQACGSLPSCARRPTRRACAPTPPSNS